MYFVMILMILEYVKYVFVFNDLAFGCTYLWWCDDVNANRYDQMDVCIKVTISPKVFQIVSTAALHKSLNF